MQIKKILVLNGSPKKENSATMVLTNAFLNGIKKTIQCEIECVNLSDLTIKPCLGCLSCWGRTEGECVIKNDDLLKLKRKIEQCDCFIESYPLYFFGMPGQVKVLTDRLLSMLCTYEGQVPPLNGESFHGIRGGLTGKKFLIFSTCAYSQTEIVYDALLKQYDYICGKDNYTAILASQTKTLIDLGPGPRLDRYLQKFENAGKEFAESGKLSDETIKKLKKPPFSEDTYVLLLSKFWERERKGE